ncbi:MAG: signal peptidase I [Planctomycetes bacterium]|nr:signal peptidase I [Planctomycetota bacterium]
MTKDARQKQPVWRHITENIECLAVAIIMALILKFYLIEAYKIPTGSMQPTIMGNAERGLFDRVLVNKFIYLIGHPQRWDVIVFKYPLDQSKNYIKRLIGLPGERVTIQKGDIYINGRIERKPEGAINAVLKEVYPNKGQHGSFRDFFDAGEDIEIVDNDKIVFKNAGLISTKQPIIADYLDGYDPGYRIPKPIFTVDENQRVGDLRLSFEVIIDEGTEGIEACIKEEGKIHRLFLKAKGHAGLSSISSGPVLASKTGEEEPVWSDREIELENDRAYEICFTNIDDRITLQIDGDQVALYDYEDHGFQGNPYDSSVSFGPVGGVATFEHIFLGRDIFYTSGRKNAKPVDYEIPPGHYFALGDNTQNSADSRLWASTVFTLNSGEEVKGNYEPAQSRSDFGTANPRRTMNAFILTNEYGDDITLSLSEIRGGSDEIRSEHFIPEKLMLGKAMVVFWPVYPHFRWKLLR